MSQRIDDSTKLKLKRPTAAEREAIFANIRSVNRAIAARIYPESGSPSADSIELVARMVGAHSLRESADILMDAMVEIMRTGRMRPRGDVPIDPLTFTPRATPRR